MVNTKHKKMKWFFGICFLKNDQFSKNIYDKTRGKVFFFFLMGFFFNRETSGKVVIFLISFIKCYIFLGIKRKSVPRVGGGNLAREVQLSNSLM